MKQLFSRNRGAVASEHFRKSEYFFLSLYIVQKKHIYFRLFLYSEIAIEFTDFFEKNLP